MKRTEISYIYKNYESDKFNEEITVCGWVRSVRAGKNVAFIVINDGSSFLNLQVVCEKETLSDYVIVSKLNVGAALRIKGMLVLTPNAKQPFELKANEITVEGESSPEYPLQKKNHTTEYLRTIPHLRVRTNTFGAVFRIRSEAALAIHRFFSENGFVYVHTPLITASDCEGAGEMFRVTSLDLDNIPHNEDGKADNSKDFFGKKASLTVSGQLEGEAMAMAFGKIYTFGPTFRAEKSYTPRHAAEFWMIEPEIAFADLEDDMVLAEKMLKYVLSDILKNCRDEMNFCSQYYDETLIDRISSVIETDFARVSYTDAVKLLEDSKKEFEYPVFWGCDLQTEHERYLTEQIFKKPVFVYDYPAEIKAFYMRENDDKKTVAAADLLVPAVGELIGGSQREERLDVLVRKMNELGMDLSEYERYLDLRRFGGAKHAGFGLGFERLIMYVTGIQNIRDVIPYPRTAGNIY